MKREPGGIRLSASDLMRFTSCAHASALDLQYLEGSELEPTADSEDALLLQRQGDAHEASYLATQRSLGGVVEIDKDRPFEAAVASTRAALNSGARVIFQGALDGGDAALSWGGWSDFLEKVETPSTLGDFSYEVADTKLKRKPDPRHLLQLVLYSDLLTPLQGRAAELAHVILGDGKRATFRLSEYSAYVNPRFGDYAPKQVTRRDIIALLEDLKKRATPTATMDTRKWLSVFFNWALEREHVDFNPVSGVRSPVKSKPRERVLSLDEARAVWKAAQVEPYPSGSLICLLMLTGARLREIGNAQVNWLDRANACLDIPGEAYKTGDPTIIPLIPEAMEIVERIPKPPRGPYLITSNGGKRPVWTATPEALTRIREGAEARLGRQIDRWTIHDLRRTAATHMARLGVDEIVVERVLGHRIGGVKGVYNRYRYIDEKREALKLWANELLGSGTTTQQKDAGTKKGRAGARPKASAASAEAFS